VPDLRDALFSPASFRGLPKLSSSRVSLARPRKLTEFCNFSATVRLLVWPNSLVFLKPREKKSSHQTAELPPWLQTGQKKKTFFFGHRNKFLAFHRGTLFRALARSGNAEVGARDPVGVLIWDDRFGVCACELFCSVFRRGITRNLRRTARHKATSKRPTCRVSESPATARKRNFTMVATGLAPVVLTETQIIRKPVTKEYDPHGAYPSSNKQWYTLVRLDEYALCSGGPDDELRELEERILSEPDDTSDDDALETNSGTSVGDETETTGEDLDPEAEPQLPREPHCNPAYQKPGGPCDHCGAAGTFRDIVFGHREAKPDVPRATFFDAPFGPPGNAAVRWIRPVFACRDTLDSWRTCCSRHHRNRG
jgi:hypothetical protein